MQQEIHNLKLGYLLAKKIFWPTHLKARLNMRGRIQTIFIALNPV